MNSNWLNRINPKIYYSNLFDFKVYTFSTFAPFAFANKKNFKSVYNIAQFFFRTARFDVSLSIIWSKRIHRFAFDDCEKYENCFCDVKVKKSQTPAKWKWSQKVGKTSRSRVAREENSIQSGKYFMWILHFLIAFLALGNGKNLDEGIEKCRLSLRRKRSIWNVEVWFN